MQWDQRHDKIFVQQEPVWFLIDGIFDLGTKAKQCLNASQRIDAHPKVNNDKVGERRKINSFSFDPAIHVPLLSLRSQVTLQRAPGLIRTRFAMVSSLIV